jgi:phosphomannomutase/phosphoglucomutase
MESPLKRLSLPRSALVAALAAVVLAVAAWLTVDRQGAGPRAPEAAVEKTATEIAAWVGGALSAELSPLRAAAEREGAVALVAGPEAVQAAEQRLAVVHSDVLRARILPRGHSQADYHSLPPLTYASLSLLQRSESQGQAPPIEGQLLGSEQQQLALLVRLTAADGALAGHALFSLAPALVQRLLDAVPWPGGSAEVLQPVDRAPAVVVARRGTPSAAPTLVRDIPGTGWRVAYRPPGAAVPAEAVETPWAAWPWALAALLLLSAGAGAAWTWRRRAQALAGPEEPERPVVVRVTERLEPASDYQPEGPPPLPTVEEISSIEPPLPPAAATPAPEPAPRKALPDPSIFLAYDIRGVVGATLDATAARAIGRAIGSEAYDRGQQALVVARDGRPSSFELSRSLIDGLVESGRDVIDVGQVPTPVLYFAAEYLDTHSGVMVTGSHNPAEYNGFKVLLGDETLAGPAVTALRRRLESGDIVSGAGSVQSLEMDAEYIRRVTEDIPAALGGAYRVAVDGANGVAGELASRLYRALGHDVIEVRCEVDGTFPHGAPDPTQPENLAELIRVVGESQADIGLAFDGDGDRLVVVDGQGTVIWPDRLLMLFAFDVLSRNPGATVIYDVKSSARLGKVISKLGGKPLLWKSGHSLIKAKMRETGALLGGELSGHVCIRDRWYGFDDALYAGARLLEILRGRGVAPAAVFAKLPTGVVTPELRVPMSPQAAVELVTSLPTDAFEGARVSTLDGLRADWPDGWGLARASNTTPALVLRFEGDDASALRRVQERFGAALRAVAPDLPLPF